MSSSVHRGRLAGPAVALVITLSAAAGDDPFADAVVAYDPGANPVPGFIDPNTALGPPQRSTGGAFDPRVVSVFNAPWRPNEVVSIGAGGSLVLRFDAPVTNHPANPYGVDLIVFGNAFFVDPPPADGVCGTPAQLLSEPALIELSADGKHWIAVPLPAADALFPTQGYVDLDDPYSVTPGQVPSDFTKPVNPALQLHDFDGQSMAQIHMLYRGSGGGAGIDIEPLGLDAVTHVRITNAPDALFTPEIDAVADVSPRIAGDVTGDERINIFDLLELLQHWGPAHPAGWHAEQTGDDVIDVFDLLLLLEHWSP